MGIENLVLGGVEGEGVEIGKLVLDVVKRWRLRVKGWRLRG